MPVPIDHDQTAAAGRPSGSFLLVLATSRAGDYVIQPQLNGSPLGQPLDLMVAPGPPELNRCVVVLTGQVGPGLGFGSGERDSRVFVQRKTLYML